VARRLIYAQEARDDLEAARAWLTQPGSGPTARRKLTAIRADIRRLQQQPCLWPVGDHSGVRELPAAGGYRVFYKVEPDTGARRHRRRRAGDEGLRSRSEPAPTVKSPYRLSRRSSLPGAPAAAQNARPGKISGGA
jgi:plasmid stabilization system protein ParE